MKNTKKKIAVFFLLIIGLLSVFVHINTSPALASWDEQVGMETIAENAFNTTDAIDIREVVGHVIYVFLGFLGVIFVILIVYAGFLWMTAGGNEEQITRAKKYISNGIIGLIIILASFGITHFVIKAILNDY